MLRIRDDIGSNATGSIEVKTTMILDITRSAVAVSNPNIGMTITIEISKVQ